VIFIAVVLLIEKSGKKIIKIQSVGKLISKWLTENKPSAGKFCATESKEKDFYDGAVSRVWQIKEILYRLNVLT
jgi:uncharacterized protein with NRDE domain